MNTLKERSLALHKKLKGKVEVKNKMEVTSLDDLSLLYSPGVAEPCLEIKADISKVYDYTWKGNTVAVVSNGTAVLGLGDIGPEAGLPVMEGKSMLFKAFSNVNAVPIMLDTKDSDEIIKAVKLMAPTFGGINLEDIKAPECVYIEQELKKQLNIPVFHDDQHGTAIVVMAGLFNAFKLLNKDLKDAKVVVSGTGAAGSSIIRMLHAYGVKNIMATNSTGVVNPKNSSEYNFVVQELCNYLMPTKDEKTLSDALVDADVFIGVSMANIVSQDDVKSMNKDAVVFALANPNPEIPYDDAIAAGARIAGTGRSDYPNQVNNVLAFPGIFQGALQVRATEINEAMKLAAAEGIASMIDDKDITETNILPNALNKDVSNIVAASVARKAIETGVAQEV
ncbi:NADP-dependent malic enzyme [Erysipelothrix sp. HDW6C]|uniref:NAD(P)-dependent malic enzyme n=1 Tax=Erysipelothrix sp. HDW6C TaxID=2714930 RepID=UPI00140D459C|nr:NADP-dependent malic enzyme [Erysipelothrix sp. HDW6C]QIK68957.1 NADP-dependent malic enzyme [Erysipelothrix sp. HDW6C]